jgi:hypothetical protein
MSELKNLMTRLKAFDVVPPATHAADPAVEELYERKALTELLLPKLWKLVEGYGEPNIDGDSDIQSIAASHVSYVIRYQLTHLGHEITKDAGVALEEAARREKAIANLFLALAAAKQAVVASIGKPAAVVGATYQPEGNGLDSLSELPIIELATIQEQINPPLTRKERRMVEKLTA